MLTHRIAWLLCGLFDTAGFNGGRTADWQEGTDHPLKPIRVFLPIRCSPVSEPKDV